MRCMPFVSACFVTGSRLVVASCSYGNLLWLDSRGCVTPVPPALCTAQSKRLRRLCPFHGRAVVLSALPLPPALRTTWRGCRARRRRPVRTRRRGHGTTGAAGPVHAPVEGTCEPRASPTASQYRAADSTIRGPSTRRRLEGDVHRPCRRGLSRPCCVGPTGAAVATGQCPRMAQPSRRVQRSATRTALRRVRRHPCRRLRGGCRASVRRHRHHLGTARRCAALACSAPWQKQCGMVYP